ncbi:invasion associated locus B family protein [Ruegeria sp. SCP11]|uniref:invasion associated locus B family protein n=1 Tax=Ruegeria sp. SCP11 TaxID=3141378 RepID=UPI003335ACE1
MPPLPSEFASKRYDSIVYMRDMLNHLGDERSLSDFVDELKADCERWGSLDTGIFTLRYETGRRIDLRPCWQTGVNEADLGADLNLHRLRQRPPVGSLKPGQRNQSVNETQAQGNLMKRLVFSLVLLASVIWPGLVAAEGAPQPSLVTEQYGVWEVNCRAESRDVEAQAAGASEQRCELRTSVNLRTNQPDQRRTVDVVVGTAKDVAGQPLIIAVPSEVLLRDAVELSLISGDGEDAEPESVLELTYVRCLPTSCISQADVDETLLRQVSTAEEAQILFTDLRNQRLAVALDLTGFADAWLAFQSKGS